MRDIVVFKGNFKFGYQEMMVFNITCFYICRFLGRSEWILSRIRI